MQNFMEDPVVIVGYARTPLGAFQGVLSSISATELGACAVTAAINNANLNPSQVHALNMGCVLPASLGQAPARQVALGAKLNPSVTCVTVNKVCGSGMKAVMDAQDILYLNDPTRQIYVAGGMESMTRSPYMLTNARSGYRMGNAEMIDHLLLDGITDAYSKKSMGIYADDTAKEFNITRDEQDDFAIRSLERAQSSIETNAFAAEICPVTITDKKKGNFDVTTDEIPTKVKASKIPQLKPAFVENGTVTAANSSSIADGAAALAMMRASTAKKLSLKPIAKILGHAEAAQAPEWFTTAPIKAIQTLLNKLNMSTNDIDLFEINEAFAVVTLAAIKELNLDINKVNILGGACALGHPIGASGARIITTLLNALERENKTTGLASLCIGGGEATALVIERY